MADLSKIKLNGTTYNFKDVAARDELDNLALVASTGDYTDLQNIPTNVSDFVNDAGYALSTNLATVATSGDYDDLTDAPVAEADANVESMLNSFNLDYTSNSTSPNSASGVNF